MFFKNCHLDLSDLTPPNYGSADNDFLIDDGGDNGWEAVPFTKKSISGDDTGYAHCAYKHSTLGCHNSHSLSVLAMALVSL